MTFTPICPNCNKKMEIHKSTSGFHWYCPEYWRCGGIIDKVESVDTRSPFFNKKEKENGNN